MNNAYVFKNASRSYNKTNAGFTLIELMISIVLGLLIVAATSQLLLGGLVSSRLQQGAADAQDSGLFGLDYVSKDIRLTNYGSVQNLILTDTTTGGGVVLTADTSTTPSGTTTNLSAVRTVSNDYVSPGLLTHGDGDTVGTGNEWLGSTKVSGVTNSDQLTIQFFAPAPMANCEGVNVAAGDRVIQRYFIRADAADTTGNSLVLACDAGSISAATVPVITNFGDAGQIVMQRVEHLHILLGTQTASGAWRYYSVHDYMALTTSKPQIKSIQFSVLVRSLDNTNSNAIDSTRSFVMLDQTVTPTATGSANRYVRRVYSTTIALRNGLGSAS